ncbi:uncharacterized protein FIBRA_08880 [Fibroporia radiculosa]|uniref:Uncharacterized protein n=1 Tax=Fibroporia radiculosa TaxID=599839 RepID=J4ICL1_9APHY|nr:uncharacterized protein FIBRA_08880 [Fibroporia radiculosa]CCM06601.1 predicted protein [Fibroporia radiculosa]
MQLTWLSSAVFASFSLLSVVAATTSVKEACGTDGEVVSTNTIVHNNKEFQVTTRTCPGFAALSKNTTTRSIAGRTAVPNEKRQLLTCNTDCTVECADIADQPLYDYCVTLTDALEDLDGEYFLAPAQTLTTFNDDGVCEYAYANLDVIEYEVCYYDVGYNGFRVADECFSDYPYSYTAGGYCVSPEVYENDWILEVYYG